MPRYLKEDNDNQYAMAIRDVEECMRKNEVEFIPYGMVFLKIKGKEFRFSPNTSSFPRNIDDERLEVIGE